MKTIFELFRMLSIWKTIYFNFHYFPFKTALHLPVFIYKRVCFNTVQGRIVFETPIKTGMVRFGLPSLGIQDHKYERTVLELTGTLVFMGRAFIGQGSRICVGKEGVLTLGKSFKITGNTDIICQKEVSFGSNCLLAWDILIMDTDFHFVLDKDGKIINLPRPIIVGDHVWIGCRNTVLKGVTIASDTVISSNSTVTRSVLERNCIVGGHGKSLEILKQGIDWKDQLQ